MPYAITTVGKIRLASLLMGDGGTLFDASNSYVAVGTGSSAPDASQTTLDAEGGTTGCRKLVTSVTRVNNVISYIVNFGTGDANINVTEVGLFDASSSGTMLGRTVLPSAVPKNSGCTWELTVEIEIQP